MIGALLLLPHAALMLAAGPILAGLLQWPPRRASFWQPWRDLRRLLRKQPVRPEGGVHAELAHAASLGASVVAALLVPSFTRGLVTAPLAELVLVAGLLGLAGAVPAMAELGGAGGLQVQRRLVVHIAAGPAVLVLILVIAVMTGTTNLDAASAALHDSVWRWPLLPAAAASASALLALAEPDDAPSSFGGRDLGYLLFAGQLRRVTILSALAALLLPAGMEAAGAGPGAWLLGAVLWALKLAALCALGVALRPLRARLRADRTLELAGLGLLLALLAAVLAFAGQRAA